jgi:ATP-dependent exoDNAse (exonuclease V) alpha subunit
VTLEDKEGKTTTLPHDKAEYFEVFEHSIIGLSKGDRVRITHNGFDKDNRRLDNGMTLEVASIKKDGNIVLHNKASQSLFHLDSEYGHLTHAHCITSHASQGKTVDEVFIAQPAATFSATNAKQFYVSVSRGKERAHIYTDDKEALLDHALEIGDRLSALQLVNQKSHIDYVVENLRTEKGPRNKQPTKTPSFNNPQIDKGYEPEI